MAMAEEESSCSVPPGFRFHPTEEELVGYYLARKVASQKIDMDIIQEVDLYRIEPWDLQERCCKYGGGGGQEEEQKTAEWYFFSYKDRKYPSGTRTNRATAAGFWKATGRDKPVLSSSSPCMGANANVIGMRKTLVFYRGRAPNGRKTDWIIHEYRLESNELAPTQEEGWVVCRAFVKPMPNQQQRLTYGACSYSNINMNNPSSAYPNSNTNYYYYDSHPNAAARLLIGGTTPVLLSHGGLDAESKAHFSDMPPLHSPTVDGEPTCCAADPQHQAAAAAAGTIDWNLLSSLLPPPAPASSKNNNI